MKPSTGGRRERFGGFVVSAPEASTGSGNAAAPLVEVFLGGPRFPRTKGLPTHPSVGTSPPLRRIFCRAVAPRRAVGAGVASADLSQGCGSLIVERKTDL